MAKSSSTIYLLRKIMGRHRYTSLVATLLLLIIISFSCIGFQLYVKFKNAQAESQTIKTQFLTEAGKSFSYSKELAFINALNHWATRCGRSAGSSTTSGADTVMGL